MSKHKVQMTGQELKVQLALWNWTTKDAANRTDRKHKTVIRYTNDGKGYENGVPHKFVADLYQARSNQFKD